MVARTTTTTQNYHKLSLDNIKSDQLTISFLVGTSSSLYGTTAILRKLSLLPPFALMGIIMFLDKLNNTKQAIIRSLICISSNCHVKVKACFDKTFVYIDKYDHFYSARCKALA